MDFCLKNYITIKGCGQPSGSGQYLNQLPGINLAGVQKIADAEQVTYIGVFADVEARAWQRLLGDYRNKMRQRFRLSKDCSFEERICDDKPGFLNAWMYVLGTELMIERQYSPRINKLTTIDADKAQELKDMFTGMYENELDGIIEGTRIEKDDPCLECRPLFTRVERLP